MSENVFVRLASINVNDHTEKKAGLTYLSWAWAWDQLCRQDPDANFEYLPPQSYGETVMVCVAVTAFGKTITEHLPVMDHRNKAIANPDAFDVNKAMKRCLVKAIAHFGLGLYIYAGEDLPDGDEPKAAPTPAKSPAVVMAETHKLTKDQWREISTRSGTADPRSFVEWLEFQNAAGVTGFAALLKATAKDEAVA